MADRQAALPARPAAVDRHAGTVVHEGRPAALAEHFDTLEQQHSANTLGMWIFLASELMMFGMLFTTYTAYRIRYHEAFVEGSRHLDLLLGGINTAVLIMSTLTVALAEHSAQTRERRGVLRYLAVAVLLAVLFLGLKGLEYYNHYQEQLFPGLSFSFEGPAAEQVVIFFLLYYAMTGLHAVHLTAGIIVASVCLVLSWRGGLLGEEHWPIEMLGLYWSFVDVIWLFLFPLLYLAGRP